MMGKERVLLLFGADSRLEWGRSCQIAKAFHTLGHEVVYVDLPLALGRNATSAATPVPFPVFQPLHGLPCAKLPFLRGINYRIIASQVDGYLKSISFKPTIIWAYAPYEPRIAKLLKDLYGARYLLHDIADERISLAKSLQGKRAALITMRNEQEIAGYSDFLVVITKLLKKTKQHLHNKILVLPNGVDTSMFSPFIETEIPVEYEQITGKIVLYIGALEDWVDLEAIRFAANSSPDLTFMLVGPARVDLSVFDGAPNITILGRRPYSSMPAYIKYADVCILPFKDVEIARNSDPLKVLQYLAMCKPVVSMHYQGVKDYDGHVSIAADHARFAELLRSLGNEIPEMDDQAVLNMIESKFSWTALIEKCLQKDAPGILHEQ